MLLVLEYGNNSLYILPKWQEKYYYIAMKLKELRKKLGLTQIETSNILGVPFRTYCRYEDEERFENTFKYNQMVALLNAHASKVVLSLSTIKSGVSNACQKYKVHACYLFGSYAKNKANSDSDIDLLIVADIEGIEYYQLLHDLEVTFNKKIDLISLESAVQNIDLLNDILKDGIKIYG